MDELARSASLAAVQAGQPESGDISCDPWLIVCHCDGAFHCAWLAWACGEVGGVQGFDGECYIPGSVPGSDAVLRDVVKLAKEASVLANKERRAR
jgi:hypothetical protein